MIFTPRVKFSASLDADGNIVPGSASAGFQTLDFSGQTGEFHYLLENVSGGWEIGRYKPANGSGSRRFAALYSSDLSASAGFEVSTVGLTCSGIAPAESFVDQTDASEPPVNSGTESMAIGHGAVVEESSTSSTAIGRTATAGNRSISIGEQSVARNSSLALGTKAVAKSDSYNGVLCVGSTALGSGSVTSASGEVSMGSCAIGMPGNISHIPVSFPVTHEVAGTYDMKSVGDNGEYSFVQDDLFTANGGVFNPSNSYANKSWRRVTGVIMLQTGNGDDDIRVWDVQMLLSPTAVISSSFTDIHHGVNNPTVTFSVASTGVISATVPSLSYPKLTGHLTARRIFEG